MFTIQNISKMNLKQVNRAISNQNWSRPLLMNLLLEQKDKLNKVN